jgi:subtilisin family serine protease
VAAKPTSNSDKPEDTGGPKSAPARDEAPASEPAAAARVRKRKERDMNVDFLGEIGAQPPTVLVELKHAVQVASMSGDDGVLTQLKNLAGEDPTPVFTARGRVNPVSGGAATFATMRSADQSVARDRFLEFKAKDAGKAGELAEKIRKAGLGDVADVLPVPTAVPAIGPATGVVPANANAFETPNFFNRMAYLGAGPVGLGYLDAWSLPGGDGQDVTVIDIEGAWHLDHEEMTAARFNLWSGVNMDSLSWKDHGVAVAAILAASHNGSGTASVCPGARVGMVSVFTPGNPPRQRIANQISEAGALLNAGDVMLLELQRPGPKTQYMVDDDQKGYIPLVFWPDVRAVVRGLVERGVTVVSVAGNGGENLDDDIYAGRFDLSQHDSGCILVGAGAPPTGDFGPARSRLAFSNYGSAVDCQAWGQLVTTAGYGDLWGADGVPTDRFTGQFMGTSAAAPLVAGALACVQGRHKAVYGAPVNPLYLRQLLRTYGWRAENDENEAPTFALQPDIMQLMHVLGLV